MQACTPNLLESNFLSSRLAVCRSLGKPSQNAGVKFYWTGLLAGRGRGRAAQSVGLAASSLERTRRPLAQTSISSTSLLCDRKPAFGQSRSRRASRKGVCRSSLAELQPVYELANGDTISPWSLVILALTTMGMAVLSGVVMRGQLEREVKEEQRLKKKAAEAGESTEPVRTRNRPVRREE